MIQYCLQSRIIQGFVKRYKTILNGVIITQRDNCLSYKKKHFSDFEKCFYICLKINKIINPAVIAEKIIMSGIFLPVIFPFLITPKIIKGTVKKSGLNLNAACISPLKRERYALVIPQPAHSILRNFLNGQWIPEKYKNAKLKRNAEKNAIGLIAFFIVLFFFISL